MLKQNFMFIKIWIKLFIFCVFTRTSSPICSEGCLRCKNLINECEICDNVLNYFDDRKGGCVKIEINNCFFVNAQGKCELCLSNFKPRTLSGDCVEVFEQEQIANCLHYDADANCVQCVAGYYQKSGLCRQVLIPIEGCEKYKSESPEVCLECAVKTMLNKDGTSCEQVPQNDNCVAYNYYDCQACSKNFYYEPNAYMTQFLQSNDQMYRYMLDVMSSSLKSKIGDFCKLKSIQNCEEFLFETNCMKCSSGYFRDEDGRCVIFPDEPLKGCQVYKGEGLCQQCVDAFYLENNQCKATSAVSNCLNYAVSENKCSECNPAFHLNAMKECVARVASLNDENCSLLETDLDRCRTCRNDFVLNNNGVCVQGISDCDVYSGSVGGLACNQCKDTYFFSAANDWCEQPLDFATSPCLKYGNSQDECRECKPGFYMDSTCIPHTNLDMNCSVSSGETANECLQCSSGFGLFPNTKVCLPVTTPNPNCLKWRSATECDECIPNYQAPNCTLIPIEENCSFKIEGSSVCSQCREGFFQNVNTNNLCISALDFEKSNCLDFSLPVSSNIVRCNSCVKASFFMEIENFFGCMLRNKYPTFGDCDMLDSGLPTNTCVKCKPGKVLEGSACLDTCSSGKIRARTTISIDTNDNDRLGISAVNTCETVPEFTQANCEIVVPTVDTETPSFVCAKCASGFKKVYDLTTPNKTFNYNTDEDHYDDIIVRHGSFACKALDMMEDYLADNCEVFGETSTGKHGCLRCTFGYTGYIKRPIEEEDVFLIKECGSMSECNPSDKNLNGMTTPESLTKWKIPIETFVSCLVCTGKEMMPVVFVRQLDNQPLSPIWYNILNYVTSELPNTGVSDINSFGVISNCLTTTVGSQYGYAEDFKIEYPEFCALLLFRIDQNPNENLTGTNPTVYCVSCMRGYRIEERGSVAADIDVIRKCQAIENCYQSTWFNYCSVCLEGFMFRFDEASKVIEYDHCIEASKNELNCFASKVGGECLICKKGFSLNDEGFCEDFNFANCQASKYLSRGQLYRGKVVSPEIFDFSSVLYFHGEDNIGSLKYGCSKCTGDYIGVSNLASFGHCIESSYIQKGQFNELRFIKNCLQFGWDFTNVKHLCRQCIPGFMPNFTGTKCVEKLNYCLQASANGERFCAQCQEGFTLISNQCVQNDITNCVDFGVEQNALVCVKCSNEYYLYRKKFCLRGRVENCHQYFEDSPGQCSLCKDEHAIFNIQTGDNLCVPFLGQNCNSWDPANTNGNFACGECQADYYTGDYTAGFKTSICFGPLLIENCQQVSVTTTTGNNLSYQCQVCDQGYFQYNSGTACLALDQVDYCREYSTDTNQCTLCEDNFYLNYSGKSCVQYPKGIFGCETYRSLTECFRCQSNMFMLDNTCISIDPPDWIENCLFYSSLELCLECEAGYFLEKNICKSANAVNCLEYANLNACRSCPEGYGFMEDSGVTSCILINIPSCEKTTHNYPFHCIICKKGFYQSAGGCFPSDKILNCDYYLANKVCLRCSQGFVRSLDGRSCLDSATLNFPVDSQCSDAFLSPKRVCSACAPGYFLSENICKQCLTDGKCMLCNPNDSKKCLVCAPGTVMLSNGACKGSAFPNFLRTDLKIVEELTLDSHVMIFRLAFLMNLIIHFFT